MIEQSRYGTINQILTEHLNVAYTLTASSNRDLASGSNTIKI
jgi:hypothetical protein